MSLGNTLLEQTTFNSRLQPTLIQLGVSTSSPQSVLGLAYTYSTMNHQDNNGNLLRQTINAGATQIGSQTYTYDGVNRLQTATEGTAWNQIYDYDQFGNRAVRSSSQYIPNPTLTPQSANATDFSAFDQTKNQIKSTLGFQYDSAGNQTGDPNTGPNNIVYDAENRQVSYTRSSATGYGYDGEGHRVTKTTGGATTVFVYNIAGQLIAEYGGTATNVGTSYLTADSLDSTRVVTDKNQGMIARHDYIPFGEELPAGMGSRTVALGYVTTDDTSQRFTQKERDSESGLDYFGARYYSSSQGRFTSTDPIILDRNRMSDPQILGSYFYTRGNPLRYIDPIGEEIKTTGSDADRKRYANDLSQKTGLQLTVDKKGAVVIEGKDPGGKNLSGAARVVYDAIKSDKTVNISLVENNGSVDFGTPYSLDRNGNVTTSVQRIDFGDLDVANRANIADFNEQTVVLHETIEAIGIQGKGLNPDDAHNLANQFSPGLQPAGQPTVTDLSAIGLIVANLPFEVQRPGGTSLTATTLITLPPTGTRLPAANDTKGQLILRQSNPVSITAVRKN